MIRLIDEFRWTMNNIRHFERQNQKEDALIFTGIFIGYVGLAGLFWKANSRNDKNELPSISAVPDVEKEKEEKKFKP